MTVGSGTEGSWKQNTLNAGYILCISTFRTLIVYLALRTETSGDSPGSWSCCQPRERDQSSHSSVCSQQQRRLRQDALRKEG